MKYESYFGSYLKAVEKILEQVLPPADQYPSSIHEAMRYAVFPGGKRFRPVLVLAACEALNGPVQDALIPAAALELIHCYSLVHDDLPALDNDDLRRGKPTCHKKYGEATGILAGDALLNLAYQILSDVKPPAKAVCLLAEISTAAGTYGMIGGQVVDLDAEKKDANAALQDYINSHKTGKLITASAVCGALAADASAEAVLHMRKYGEYVGLAFQAVDDLHDGDGYMRLVESKEIVQKIRHLLANAKKEIRLYGDKAEKLHSLADFLLERTSRGAYAVDQQN